jgi:peptidyl-tRNA hydrolase
MYIVIKEGTPRGHAVNCAAHAALACYLEYKDHYEVQEWLKESFRKVTCTASYEEFEAIKYLLDDLVVITESALNDAEVALAIPPLYEEWPDIIRNLKLYR